MTLNEELAELSAGIVRDVDVDPDYTTPLEPAATLAAVRKAIGRP